MTSLFPVSTLPAIADNDVHVWQVSLQQPAAVVTALHRLLNEEEAQRAARFHFPADQRRFTIGRGLLRLLLGRYLEAQPAQLHFAYNAYGKPQLAVVGAVPPLHFNLSHSGEIALYAFTRHYHLGIDVEQMRANLEWDALAQHVFSPHEQATLARLPVAEQLPAFFRCWTRKEAFIKARGMGLSLPLDQFDVTLAPDDPAQLLATRDDPQEATRWTLSDLPCPAGYAAALAVGGHGWNCECATIDDLHALGL
ncbi:MAG: 4'-phosphopantetheinyl transferase superfamily protein [Caldilineaceae bacterium]